jgi:hypothetical protein
MEIHQIPVPNHQPVTDTPKTSKNYQKPSGHAIKPTDSTVVPP